MSVLSRQWKHVWSSIPKLVFSADFCHNKPLLINVITTILLQHSGAIKTFLVNISSIPSSQHSVIDEWILLLSRNGILDLTDENLDKDRLILNNAPYKLPSYLYNMNKLESLTLTNCIFRPPCSFRGFHMLKNLSLVKVVLHLDAATSFFWMPDLMTLLVKLCCGFPHEKLYAPKLSQISFLNRRSKLLELSHYMKCRMLTTVILSSSQSNQDKPINLTYLLKCWPKVCNFGLHTYYLKFFATEAERLPTYLNSLRSLSIYEFDFDDEDHIFALLGMLRISSNMNQLHLDLLSSKKKGGMEVYVNYFEGPAYRTLGQLHKLQRLIIKNFHGSRSEMLFIRFILASAPLLVITVLIEDAESVDESKYTKELMGFPRASPKLQIYVNHKKK